MIKPRRASFALLKAGSVYSGSLMVQRSLGVLMIPLYVPAMGATQYGQLALLIAAMGIVVTISSFGLEAIVLRTFLDLSDQPSEQRRFVTTVQAFLLITSLTCSAIALVATYLLATAETTLLVALALAGCVLQVQATVVPFAVWRAEEKPLPYARTNVQYSLLMALMVVFLVLVLALGIWGWLVANLFAWACVTPLTLSVARRYWSKELSSKLLWPALVLAIPLVPHALAQWGLSLSDRMILSGSVSLEEIGVYNIGYQAAAVAGLLLTALNWTVMPRITSKASTSYVTKLFSVQIFATGVICLCCALLGPIALQLFLPSEFGRSAAIVPWVTLGFLFFGLYYIPMDILVLQNGKTKWIWICTALAATGNIALNLFLVPVYGIEAAAFNTAAGYGILLVAVTSLAALQTNLLRDFPWAAFAVVSVILSAGYLVAIAISPQELWSAGLVRGLCIVVSGALAAGLTPVGRQLYASLREERLVTEAIPQ